MKWNEKRIVQVFRKMETEGWNTAKPLKWGFTFMNTEKDGLLDVFNEVKDYGYRLIKIEFREDLELWLLYVTKEEALVADKLHRRNLAFEELANYCNVERYDGWDVEQIKSKDIKI